MKLLETRGGKVAPAGGQTHPPQRILVVNDENDTRQFYCEVLTQSGYQVDTAQDGDDGCRPPAAIPTAMTS
jgi:CheY-like chemotaxis protein